MTLKNLPGNFVQEMRRHVDQLQAYFHLNVDQFVNLLGRLAPQRADLSNRTPGRQPQVRVKCAIS